MKSKFFAATAWMILAVAAFCFAEEKKSAQDQQAAMMKAWTEFATPGAPHKMMQNMVGTWDTTAKLYMDPSAPPAESKGTSTFAMLLDGRYLQETSEGTYNGMPFHGMGTYAYDNLMKKYYSTWIDNMGTGIMTSEGASTDGGKTIEYKGHSSDPMSGKSQNYRSVIKMVNQDQYQFEMFGPGPGGKEMKVMEMTYNRKK